MMVKSKQMMVKSNQVVYAIFKNKTFVEIMKLLFLNSDKKFYLREICRKTNCNIKTVSNELNRLEEAGLILSARKGNQKYFSSNKESRIFSEISNIIKKTEAWADQLRKQLNKLNGIKTAFVYGSFAQGRETGKSDIDLIIIGKPDMNKLAKEIREIEEKLGREVNYSVYSEKEFEKGSPFLKRVKKEKKVYIKK